MSQGFHAKTRAHDSTVPAFKNLYIVTYYIASYNLEAVCPDLFAAPPKWQCSLELFLRVTLKLKTSFVKSKYQAIHWNWDFHAIVPTLNILPEKGWFIFRIENFCQIEFQELEIIAELCNSSFAAFFIWAPMPLFLSLKYVNDNGKVCILCIFKVYALIKQIP
jgi:hypothetical protein